MRRQTEGSRAVAETIALCRPEVIAAYPISPQTHIVEGLSRLVKAGRLAPCEFLNVESEFAAMSVCIGASATGARTYTATASQGLLYMVEAVYNASGLGLPIVMTVANRAIGSPINIWNDHSDAMSQRDSGWIQLYAESNQEALDLHVQAFRLAEELSLPVMVCMDGFVLTHAHEQVDLPTQEQVDAFLPPFQPRQVLDPDDPVTIGAMVGPEAFMEVRYLMHAEADAGARRHPADHRRLRVELRASTFQRRSVAVSAGGLGRGWLRDSGFRGHFHRGAAASAAGVRPELVRWAAPRCLVDSAGASPSSRRSCVPRPVSRPPTFFSFPPCVWSLGLDRPNAPPASNRASAVKSSPKSPENSRTNAGLEASNRGL